MLKIFIFTILATVCYCQKYEHSHTTLHETVITHEVPSKVENYNYEDENNYREFDTSDEYNTQTVSQSLDDQATQIDDPENNYFPPRKIPTKPAPVYEAQEPVRAPVNLKFAPYASQHRVIQLVQQTPIKAPVIKVPSFEPVHHQPAIAPIIYQTESTPIIQQAASGPIIHQSSVQHRIIGNDYEGPVQQEIVETSPIDFYESSDGSYHEESHESEPEYRASHRGEGQQGSNHEIHNDYQVNHGYNYARPKYEFSYGVKDSHDQKYQAEYHDDDIVKGGYSLHELGGSLRTDNYGSDKNTGFSSEVNHNQHTEHIVVHH